VMVVFAPTELARRPAPEPPAVPVRLGPAALYAVGKDFVAAQGTCAQIMNTLHNKLWDNSATFGQDGSATEFVKVYEPAADKVFAGFVQAHRLLGAIGKGLAVSAENHRAADAASTPAGHSTTDPFPLLTPDSDIQKLDVPKIAGDSRSWLPGQLVHLWPICNQGKADAISQAYSDAKTGFEKLVNVLYTNLRKFLNDNDSEDLRALNEFFGRVAGSGNTFFVTFPKFVDKVGSAVRDYAYQIQDHAEEFNKALKQATEDALDLAAIFLAIDILSRGMAALFTGPEAALIAGRAAVTMAPVAESLRVAVTASQVINAATVAGVVFIAAMADAPKPNIETSDATHIGDQVQSKPSYPRNGKLPHARDLIKNGTEFQGNKLPSQSTPNSVLYKRDPQTGNITNYTVYDDAGYAIKRVDLTGRPHGGTPTPHVHHYTVNRNPQTGQVYVNENKVARPATPEEIP
jgi:hypothetical protein